MAKVITSREAFKFATTLRLTVGVIAPCGTRLGILYSNGCDDAPLDLTVQGEGDTFHAEALTEDGRTFLAMCPIE